MQIHTYLGDLVNLFYPKLCPGCDRPLQRTEQHICLYCSFKLPKTGFNCGSDNRAEQMFRGRIQVQQANSFLYFRKKGMSQKLMHDLKYNGNKELGVYLGEQFGLSMMADEAFRKPDIITTVPLHPHKMRKRGFNQSDEIAKGFSRATGIPLVSGVLQRSENTTTQTRKKRFERWENTQHGFSILDRQIIEGKHVGLLDDVITTGATLEACASKLQQGGSGALSIFSLCITVH